MAADLNNDDALARRWSMLNIGDATPEKPHRSKSKHKKRVNFLGHDDIIQPETGEEYIANILPQELYYSEAVILQSG